MTRKRLVIIAAVAALVATYLIVAFSYRLEHGDTGNVGEGAVVEGGVARHPLRPGRTFQIAFTIRNPGVLPVTLTDVAFTTPDVETSLLRMIENAAFEHAEV